MNFIQFESKTKLRGGYYTPDEIANFICRWAIDDSTNRVVEPSCGDGAFIRALSRTNAKRALQIKGFEIEESEATKASSALRQNSNLRGNIVNGDYLSWWLDEGRSCRKVDAVVGNPPFIRYQYLPNSIQAETAAIFDVLGLNFTRHTNAWVPFVLAGINQLRPGGRLGMVLPSEIFHVLHAQAVRSYLVANCSKVMIVDPEDLWFESILQGTVVLLAEKKQAVGDAFKGVGIVKTSGTSFLQHDPTYLFQTTKYVNGVSTEGKWTYALLGYNELSLVGSLKGNASVKSFVDVADVDVGIVTGANKFFLVPNNVVEEYELSDVAHPMFGRSEHCPGAIYDDEQHQANVLAGLPTNFLWFTGDNELSECQKRYIEKGLEEGLNTRYKCRIRNPWYSVPSVYSTSVGMLKRSHEIPRLILNLKGSFTTDTAYRISPKNVSPESLVYSFVNSLTGLSAELEGRHYGGGVLELVPSEIERLLLPKPSGSLVDVHQLDGWIRTKKASEVVPLMDRKVLASIGLTTNEQAVLHEAWRRLANRRQRKPHGN